MSSLTSSGAQRPLGGSTMTCRSKQCRREHLTRTVADNLIQKRRPKRQEAIVVGIGVVVN
jgi:hypothetical protein